MCKHRLTDLIWIVIIIVSGLIILNLITHMPKEVTTTIEKCSKPPTQAESEMQFMDKAKEFCNGNFASFKMVMSTDGTHHPEFTCQR